VGAGPERVTRAFFVILLVGVLWPAGAAAQDPPADSARVPPDSVALARPDALRASSDSLAAADTVPAFHNLPELPDGIPEGWEAAVWAWDHEELMASGAHTLVELLDQVPGVVPLIAGDYGTPAAFSALGHAAGGIRVMRDGFELMPLSGGVVDLQRVGLGGIERVRLRRGGERILVEMWSLNHDDPRPYSLVEAGTGDLDNNLFRGAFSSPNALGGSAALALERSDTRGGGAQETGSRTGSWVRYQLHRGEDAGIALDFRRMGSRSEVAAYPAPVTRTDLTMRARAKVADGVVAELQMGRSSLDVEDERLLYARDGGRRNQYAARVATDRGDLWADGAFRLFGGDDLLKNRLDLEGGWRIPDTGGLSARLTREDWKGARPVSWSVSGWARPLSWVRVFASWAGGGYAARSGPVLDATPPSPDPGAPDPSIPAWADRPAPTLWTTDRTSYRAGATLGWRGAVVSAAVLGLEQDRTLPLGLEPDLGSDPGPGATRRGWEAYGRVPLPVEGFGLVGSYQAWDVGGPYLPARIYRGSLDFHRAFMESENFEIRASLGVRGHDPMLVFVPSEDPDGATELAEVPFFQSWDATFQMRIVTVRIFLSWENLTTRRNLQAFPGRVLPALRTSYGIRWTMRN
jgi:hypothetical protein